MSTFSLSNLKKRELTSRLVNELGMEYIKSGRLYLNFVNGEMSLVDKYIDDCVRGRITYSETVNKIIVHRSFLEKARSDIIMNNIKFYAVAEKREKDNSLLNITLKQVGFISGVLQIIGGMGICKVSVGAVCGSLGAALILHGTENAWENGYFLVIRQDPGYMPIRNAYRKLASLLGGDKRKGDIAYSIGDLSLSAASLFRTVTAPDAWRLYYYMREDFIIGWRDMGAAGLVGELVGDSASGFTLYQLQDDESQWRQLREGN